MKEATGELNMTVVTVVAVAAVAAFFYLLIWPQIQANMALTTACNGDGITSQEKGDQGSVTCTGSKANGTLTCTYTSASGKVYNKTC